MINKNNSILKYFLEDKRENNQSTMFSYKDCINSSYINSYIINAGTTKTTPVGKGYKCNY